MKKKLVLLATVIMTIVFTGCGSTANEVSTISGNSMEEISTNVAESVSDIVTDEPTEVISGTTMVPINNNEETESADIESDNISYYHSSLSGVEAFIKKPDNYEVSYEDEHYVEFVKSYDESVDAYDDASDVTYYKEIIATDITNVRNTPYTDSVTYTKAQLMNSGYDYIADLNVKGRNFIVAYSPINREEVNTDEEPFWSLYPKTSICVLEVIDENVACDREDCTHTEFIEFQIFHNDDLNENDILFYVESFISNCEFDIVRG